MPGIQLPPTPEGTHNDVHRELLHPPDGAPPLERPAAAKAAGFDAVEFWWPFETSVPTDVEVARFENAITDAGVQLTGLNFNAGDMPGGDRGLVSWPARSTEFQDNIDVVAGIGERLGCKAFNALYGNRIDGESAEQQDAIGAENLAAAAAGVARIGGTVLLEPVSGAPRYPLLKAQDALDVIARVKQESGAGEHQAPRRLLPPGRER